MSLDLEDDDLICPKCKERVDPTDNLNPVTGTISCPKCGRRLKSGSYQELKSMIDQLDRTKETLISQYQDFTGITLSSQDSHTEHEDRLRVPSETKMDTWKKTKSSSSDIKSNFAIWKLILYGLLFWALMYSLGVLPRVFP
jgi:hypothetical protein